MRKFQSDEVSVKLVLVISTHGGVASIITYDHKKLFQGGSRKIKSWTFMNIHDEPAGLVL